jgi:hypothetical protein
MVELPCLVSQCAKLHVAGWTWAVFTHVYLQSCVSLSPQSGYFWIHPGIKESLYTLNKKKKIEPHVPRVIFPSENRSWKKDILFHKKKALKNNFAFVPWSKQWRCSYAVQNYMHKVNIQTHSAYQPFNAGLNPSMQRCLMRFFYWAFCFLNRAFP